MDIIPSFTISRLPRIVFGSGSIAKLPEYAATYGSKILIVTGALSFRNTLHWDRLLDGLKKQGCQSEDFVVAEEPSPQLVDDAVSRYKDSGIQAVLGVGGGSVLDAAKAIAGLLPYGNSVMDHLEGVGRNIPYAGPPLPLIAVPTTAGTGSEATKNAVLSQQGPNGFKKSFRHDDLVAQLALIDPDLLASCPFQLIAAEGMDAFTQLLESYVSTRANPITDALAVSGLKAFFAGFWPVWEYHDAQEAAAGRTHLAYASLLSGINLAQTGLGSVHGLASPLGAYFPCPHGVVCGTLVAEASDINIRALQERNPKSEALFKYARAGALISRQPVSDPDEGCYALVSTLREWTARLELPRLGSYGMKRGDIPKVVANSRGSSMQTNPVELTDAEIGEVLQRRL